MNIPDGVTKLSIFDVHTQGHEAKWKLYVASDDVGFYICDHLGPLWTIFYDAYNTAKNGGAPGVSMMIVYPEGYKPKQTMLCAFRHELDRLVPNRISKGMDAYELEKKMQADETNVAKPDNDYGLRGF